MGNITLGFGLGDFGFEGLAWVGVSGVKGVGVKGSGKVGLKLLQSTVSTKHWNRSDYETCKLITKSSSTSHAQPMNTSLTFMLCAPLPLNPKP